MPNFLQNVFENLQRSADRVVLREVRGDQFVSVTGSELLARVERARDWLRASFLETRDRCGLIAANSIDWIAADLALMAEGIVVVPLYHRQTPGELVAMFKDCQPRFVLTGDVEMGDALANVWPGMPQRALFNQLFAETAA